MKNQALFSSKDKSKELKCRLLNFVWRFKVSSFFNITEDILISISLFFVKFHIF